MSVTTTSATPNYSFTLPTIGGDQNTWGNELNGNWSKLDGILHSISVTPPPSGGSAYLPINGGQMQGPLYLNADPTSAMMAATMGYVANNYVKSSGGAYVGGNFKASGNIACNSLGVGFDAITDFGMACNGNNRALAWATNVYDMYAPSNGIFSRNYGGSAIIYNDSTGAINIASSYAGKPGGGPWNATSDDRTKKSVQPYTAGLDEVVKLAPITFSYNGKGGTIDDARTYYGLSAQATRNVMPELVCFMPQTLAATAIQKDGKPQGAIPGLLATDLTALPMAMINAIRELAERVTALEEHGA